MATASTPPSGPLQRPWPTTSSPPRWPIRALAQRLAEAEDERRELERERRRLAAESERLRAEVQRHAVARRAYEQRRAELSAALARAGRDSAGR
jgi:histidinol-phosphate/aromatic aminotransferase/cobyric acid decarboxylase-like protein